MDTTKTVIAVTLGVAVALSAALTQGGVGDVLDDATAAVVLSVPADKGSFHALCEFKADSTVLAAKGIQTPSGVLQGHGDFCVLGLNGGSPLAQRIPGVYVFGCVTDKAPCDPAKDPAATGWLQGSSKAAFTCACASGPACTWTRPVRDGKPVTGPAPLGSTLAAGTWVGSDCTPKPCVTLGSRRADDSWPASCPTR